MTTASRLQFERSGLAPPEPAAHRFTRDEYARAFDSGVFGERRVELLEGTVIDMSPVGSRHAAVTALASEAIRNLFDRRFHLRTQSSLGLSSVSEPEPDIAVVEGTPRDFLQRHPASAVLVVEVAETSLNFDRTVKASLYARHGIGEYWILNLADAQVEVHRDPVADPADPAGARYASRTIVKAGETIRPMSGTAGGIDAAELLP